MNVIFLPEIRKYYDELEQILYDKGYFGFMESSKRYVKELIDDIVTNLPLRPSKPTPKYFDKYGKNMKYTGFRKNRNTTWYVFFDTYKVDDEIFYLVRYIANNHTIAQHLYTN